MSIKLRELIRQVRSCKTAAEERAVIAKECARCRKAFKDKNDKFRHRNVAKLLYIHMLGYPSHFGQMETLKLIASPKFSEKRIGYLALMVIMDERQDILMLVTNNLHNDFKSDNPYVVGLSLCAMGNICSHDMARNLQGDIRQFFNTPNIYLRKKAILCAIRCVRKAPDLVEDFISPVLSLLHDKNHAVLLCGICLLIEMINIDQRTGDGQLINKARKTVPTLIKRLKDLVLAGYVSEYDVVGITDPFLQTKIMQLLRLLGTGDPEASDLMNDILAQVAINTESAKNPGNCILYECVQTIMAIDAEGSLRVLAINILGRFLLNNDNNIRYVALNILCNVVDKDTAAIHRHRNTIVDCLKDSDISIRRRALDLIYALVTKNNVEALIKELLNYLSLTSGDAEFKTELTDKICQVAKKYAPNKQWHIETIISVLVIAGNFTRETVTSELIVLISRSKSLYAFVVHKLYHVLKQKTQKPQLDLIHVGLWCIGEYGDLLVSDEAAKDAQKFVSDNSKFKAISSTKILNLVERLMRSLSSTNTTREYILNSLIKLSVRFDGEKNNRIKKMIGTYKTSMSLELQQRSCEYTQLISPKFKKITPGVISRMPVPSKKKENAKNEENGNNDDDDDEGDEDEDEDDEDDDNENDDDDDDDDDDDEGDDDDEETDEEKEKRKKKKAAKANAKPKTTLAFETNILDMDLLSDAIEPVQAGGSSDAQSIGAMDNLGSLEGIFDNPQPTTQQTQSNQFDPFDIFSAPHPQQQQRPQDPITEYPPAVVFESKGLTVTFACSRKKSSPQILSINASFTNGTSSDMTNWEFQLAVPKYLKLTMESGSGTIIPANNNGKITQIIKLENTLHGKKVIRIRLRLSYNVNGNKVTEQTQVDSLP